MTQPNPQKPIDYLLIGHITADLQADGSSKLGGTASFSGLTAQALSHEVGLLTSFGDDADLKAIESLQICNAEPSQTTSFRNIYTPEGREQYCYNRASNLQAKQIPDAWKSPKVVHFGPVANEIDPDLFDAFPNSLLYATPQGMLRAFADDGKVFFRDLENKESILPKLDAVVLSLEDLQNDENLIAEYASLCKLLVITENKDGARVYFKGERRHFPAPHKNSVDETGAGDIFAASFFHRLSETNKPWEAARFAVELSANSVTRYYLESVPSQSEIEHAKIHSSI